MDPLRFAGVDMCAHSENIAQEAGELLLSCGKPNTWRHVQAVEEACAQLARRFGLDEEQCRLAGILHDISAVMPAAEMLRYARDNDMPLDAAEINHPFLLHQRISALVAQQCFAVQDAAVLNAIACHTTLRANASDVDMALFLADKIAWDQPGEPPFLDVVNAALLQSLKHGCRVYINYVMDNGMILQPHADLLAARKWLNEE